MEPNPELRFPYEVLSGAAGAFADVYGEYLEVPKHFLFMAYLTCLGSLVADQLTLASELKPQPRFYTLLLGESADDRKSTAISKTVSFFEEAAPNGLPVCWGVGSAEGLQKKLQKGTRLVLCLDEFKSFVGKCKIKSSVLLPCVSSLFEQNRYESQTSDREIVLDGVYLSLLAASTIHTYENTWSPEFTDIGLPNRLWLVPGGAIRKFPIPRMIPEEARLTLKDQLRGVLRHIRDNGELDLTPEARDIYDAWYFGREASIHGKRLDTYALRLMILLATNRLKPNVDAETVRDVIALCNHQHQLRRLYDPIDADNKVAAAEEKIRRVLKVRNEATTRDLTRALNTNRVGNWMYDMAIKNLLGAKEIQVSRKTGRYSLTEAAYGFEAES